MIKKRKILKLFVFIAIFFMMNIVNANTLESEKSVLESVGEGFGLSSYVSEIDKCIKETGAQDIDVSEISQDLLNGKGIGYSKVLTKILSILAKEVFSSIKGAIFIFIIVLLMSVMSGISLEKNSDIVNIAHLICFVAIAGIAIITFKDTIVLFKNTTDILSKIMQIASPFLIAILIGTGAITTTGIIQPSLLFISSLIGFIITYIVIPFITISVILNIVSAMSENLRFSNLSKIFNKTAIWVVGIVLTLFLGILALETSLTSSIDSLTLNVTQSAVSNFVPVVGKFFSDSLESVIGATKIIGKTGGILGIITMIIISSIPILKILSIIIVYLALGSIVEIVCKEEKINKFICGMKDVYKNLLGILIGLDMIFIISIGIILNLCGKISN